MQTVKLTEKEIADIDYAVNAIYKQSAKVPFKPVKEQPDSSPINIQQNIICNT
jgi:hypothetical protein